MENKKHFNTPKVPGTTEVFPQAIIADKLVFLFGATGFNPKSKSFEKQARQAF